MKKIKIKYIIQISPLHTPWDEPKMKVQSDFIWSLYNMGLRGD